MRPPRRRQPLNPVLSTVGRLLLLFGGLTLALRFTTPQRAGPQGQIDADRSGRGRPSAPPSPEARAEGHETEDFSGGVLARLVLMLFVVATCVGFGMYALGHMFETMQSGATTALTAQQTTHIAPPAPNVQADPVGDLVRLRAKEDALLTNYAWDDAAHTRARIPISRAMMLVTGKSLDTAP